MPQDPLETMALSLNTTSTALTKEMGRHLPAPVDRELYLELSAGTGLRPLAFRRIIDAAKPESRELVPADFDEKVFGPGISVNKGREVIGHIDHAFTILERLGTKEPRVARQAAALVRRYGHQAVEFVEGVLEVQKDLALAFFGRDIVPLSEIVEYAFTETLENDENGDMLYYSDVRDFFRSKGIGTWEVSSQ